MMKIYMIRAMAIAALMVSGAAANAAGCVSGAVVGGVAGHMAGGHGALGPAAGCAVGHHEANKQAKAANAPQATTPQAQPSTQTKTP